MDKTNGCTELSNVNKYSTRVSNDESKDTLKKYHELWNKIRYFVRSISNNSDYYDKKIYEKQI